MAVLRLAPAAALQRPPQVLLGFPESAVLQLGLEALGDQVRPGDQLAGLAVDHDGDDHDPIVGEVLAVTELHLAVAAISEAIHQDGAGADLAALGGAVPGELQDAADLRQQDPIGRDPGLRAQLAVEHHVAELAVDRHRELGPEQVQHLAQLVPPSVTGDVNAPIPGTVDDARAAPEQVVDGAGDGLFVAGDRGGGEQDHVALADPDLRMLGGGNAGQGCRGLALAAGDHQHPLVLRQLQHLVQRGHQPLWRVQVAEFLGDAGVLLHAAAGHRHLAAVLLGSLESHVDAADVGGEGGDHHHALGRLDGGVHLLQHHSLRRRAAVGLDADGVGEERQHPFIAEAAEAALVSRRPHHGRGVKLEIGRVQDGANRSVHSDGVGVRDGVGDVDELHRHRAKLDPLSRLHRTQIDGLVQACFQQLALDEAQRQGAAVDRDRRGVRDLRQHVGQAADVVLMAMSDDDGPQIPQPLADVADVGDDQVDPALLLLRELAAAVQQDQILSVLDGGHILADLSDPTERNHPEPVARPSRRKGCAARCFGMARTGRTSPLTTALRPIRPSITESSWGGGGVGGPWRLDALGSGVVAARPAGTLRNRRATTGAGGLPASALASVLVATTGASLEALRAALPRALWGSTSLTTSWLSGLASLTATCLTRFLALARSRLPGGRLSGPRPLAASRPAFRVRRPAPPAAASLAGSLPRLGFRVSACISLVGLPGLPG